MMWDVREMLPSLVTTRVPMWQLLARDGLMVLLLVVLATLAFWLGLRVRRTEVEVLRAENQYLRGLTDAAYKGHLAEKFKQVMKQVDRMDPKAVQAAERALAKEGRR